MQRVMKAIGHQEPDRVPLFLLFGAYGARELGMPVEEYFSSASNVIKAQLQLKEKYNNDCVNSFFYAALETEAWGGKSIFKPDGAPIAGAPVIQSARQIPEMRVPEIEASPGLARVLETIRGLKEAVADQVPIIGVVMSPFSLPVMQMRFEPYLRLLYSEPGLFWKLMRLNTEFCVAWANAQLEAGATAICYFDPLASPTIIERSTYLKTGFTVARELIGRIRGPVATHLASGRSLEVLEDVADTGSLVLGFSSQDPLPEIKAASRGKICLLGNLNAVDMINWSPEQAEERVKAVIAAAGPGGGLILSDNHGEIPWLMPERVLLAISGAVQRWGQYPLEWTNEYYEEA